MTGPAESLGRQESAGDVTGAATGAAVGAAVRSQAISHPTVAGEVLASERLPTDALRVGRRIAAIVGDDSDEAVLALCLALSALSNGSVLVDLSDPEAALPVEEEQSAVLSWPPVESWSRQLARSPVTGADDAPLGLEGSRLYLQRYWQAEQRIADNLLARIGGVATPGVPGGDDSAGDGDPNLDEVQREAVATALANRLTILTGGPGTGKTYTIARILRAFEQSSARFPTIALAAPTGKAAARLKQAIAGEQDALGAPSDANSRVSRMSASTLHGLLEPFPGSLTMFRRDRGNPLPHDVVIIDETSMVDVAMLDALLQALRPDSRLILVGDADQLASVSAGNALSDLVGSGVAPTVRLTTNYRNVGGVAALARAIRDGDVAEVDALLGGADQGAADTGLHWFDEGVHLPVLVAEWISQWGTRLRSAAAAGDVSEAVAGLEGLRVLCAHREGRFGVSTWSRHVVSGFQPSSGEWPLGQPTMVTKNRVVPGLFNGDTGVVVDLDGSARVAFSADRLVAPERLGSEAVPAYALTIHKSQGSQFDRVVVVLPEPQSRILTRELLYTAVTRARKEVAIVGSRESLHAALDRRVARASGLTERLRSGSVQQ